LPSGAIGAAKLENYSLARLDIRRERLDEEPLEHAAARRGFLDVHRNVARAPIRP
jgi:hypothetical protein